MKLSLLLIDPMSRPVAISEIIVLLILCTLVGWLLANWLTYQRSKRLLADLRSIRKELDECQQKKCRVSLLSRRDVKVKKDNLKVIEGIGPKIEELLYREGIDTYADLAGTDLSKLLDLLNKAGEGFQMHDPTSWPLQSRLVQDGKWAQLKRLQDQLIGGRQIT
ncbi:hypothetical protein SAMN05216327_12321 [Dyadobacter sp. SG02]|uniref:hypothetical protein n=1 Tax=Dyadobacter sp. SG02 TaxID=1855291 RepID=UPI0008CC742F|nr:hypothetical protein [Dyadobacter sp. SG02]SEJ83677.1 hypothetical protein SAMN05216327_12321 [Dyadobacter sp. SG02]